MLRAERRKNSQNNSVHFLDISNMVPASQKLIPDSVVASGNHVKEASWGE